MAVWLRMASLTQRVAVSRPVAVVIMRKWPAGGSSSGRLTWVSSFPEPASSSCRTSKRCVQVMGDITPATVHGSKPVTRPGQSQKAPPIGGRNCKNVTAIFAVYHTIPHRDCAPAPHRS